MPFLAQAGQKELINMLIPIIVVTLSMLIPIVAIIVDFLQKRERMRLIATALEHGANLEDLNLEDAAEKKKLRLPYRNGMVTLSVGVALLLADRFIGFDFGSFHFPLLAGGLVTSCVGTALLLNDWLNRNRLTEEARQSKQPDTRI